MNKGMIGGLIRHFLTILSVSILANGTDSIQDIIAKIASGFATGDIQTIVASATTLAAILWSVWVKATEETKISVIKTLTLGMGR